MYTVSIQFPPGNSNLSLNKYQDNYLQQKQLYNINFDVSRQDNDNSTVTAFRDIFFLISIETIIILLQTLI